MFYEQGVKLACTQLQLEKTALSPARLLQQLKLTYSVPAGRAELLRMAGGGALGALGGGVAGGAGEEGSTGKALIGALLGGVGGSLGARGLGRLQEGRIAKALKARKDIPFSERAALKSEALGQVVPRMPKLEAAPGAAPTAGKATEGLQIPAAEGGPAGTTNIPPHLLEKMRASGMV